MAAEGLPQVTLLGQTVSSYYERGHDFADLLTRVHAVEGLARIRFTSPYPNDFFDRSARHAGVAAPGRAPPAPACAEREHPHPA
ncbi:MAG: hypothetical protein R3F60_19890 [bacterium]